MESIDKQKLSTFRVGDWHVDVKLGRVRSSEGEGTLQPQVMQLLVYMAKHAGEVISVDRMIEDVWSGKPMTGGSVYNALNTLRKAFGDSKDNLRYIETIPRRGYRLIAEVQWGQIPASAQGLEVHGTQSSSVTPDALIQQSPRDRAAKRPVILVMLVLVAIVFLWFGKSPAPLHENLPTTTIPPEKSIAVLPFIDKSPNGDQAYFAEGIAEEILHLISRHSDLKVVGRSSSFRFRGEGIDLKFVGQELGVAHILEGSVRRDGNRLRITAQLITAKDGFHVWSESFDGEAGDLFNVQDRIAQRIAEQLQLSVLGPNAAIISARSRAPSDISAHDLYLLARYRVNLGGKENIDEAIGYLKHALEIDPDYARAHVEMAYALHGLSRAETGSWGVSQDLQVEIVRHAEIALSLDANLSGAYAIQGTLNYIKAFGGQDLPGSAEVAIRQLRRALELNPNDGRALLWASGMHRLLGRPYLDAVEMARRSIELEPLLSYAAEYYLYLISELADRRIERWQLVEKLGSGAMDWEGNEIVQRAFHHFLDGELAKAFELTYKQSAETESISELRHKSMIPLALGSPDLLPARVKEESNLRRWFIFGTPMAEVYFPERGIERCEDTRQSQTHTLSGCAAFGLRIARYDWVQNYLDQILPVNEEEYLLKFRHTFHLPDSVAMSQATLAYLNEDYESLEKHLAMVEAFLKSFEGEPPTELKSTIITRAHIHALREEGLMAVEALHRALDTGERMFVHFMHPAFEAIRREPGFVGVMERWIDLINEERSQLDLSPLHLDYDAEPGSLPFELDKNEHFSLSDS